MIGVGRNLNRAIRTCYSFGIYDVYCLNCTGCLTGNLFSSENKVKVHNIKSLDIFNIDEILAFESNPKFPPLRDYPTDKIKYIAIGGESTTLRKRDFINMVNIETSNRLCLTTEAALAISLFEISTR